MTITSYSNGAAIDTCTLSISGLVANPLSSLTITPTSTMTVNKAVSLRFLATLSDTINNRYVITITLPAGSNFTLGSYSTSPGTHVLTQSGNIVTVALASSFKAQPAGTVMTIMMGSYTAPASTQVTDPFTFAVSLNGYATQTGTATTQAVASTLAFKVTPSTYEVSRNASYVFNLTTNDAIGGTGRIRIDFPSTIGVSVPASNCATLSGVNVSSTNLACSQPTANSLVLSSISSSTRIPAQSNLLITIPSLTNPASTQPTSSFTVTTYFSTTDGTLVATSTSESITATPGSITNGLVTPSSSVVLATGVTYTV